MRNYINVANIPDNELEWAYDTAWSATHCNASGNNCAKDCDECEYKVSLTIDQYNRLDMIAFECIKAEMDRRFGKKHWW